MVTQSVDHDLKSGNNLNLDVNRRLKTWIGQMLNIESLNKSFIVIVVLLTYLKAKIFWESFWLIWDFPFVSSCECSILAKMVLNSF
jgi:hypothetical protein